MQRSTKDLSIVRNSRLSLGGPLDNHTGAFYRSFVSVQRSDYSSHLAQPRHAKPVKTVSVVPYLARDLRDDDTGRQSGAHLGGEICRAMFHRAILSAATLLRERAWSNCGSPLSIGF